MPGEISEAMQIVTVTMNVGGQLVAMPFRLVTGGMDLLQKIIALMEEAKKHKPEKGEVAVDEIYKKYGNQFSVFTIDGKDKDEIYNALTNAGVIYSYYPSPVEDTDDIAIAVPLEQCRTASEAIEALKKEYINRSLAEHTRQMPGMETYLEQMKEKYASPNVDSSLLDLGMAISDFQQGLLNPEYLLLDVPMEKVVQIEGQEDSLQLQLPNGTVTIPKKGVMAGKDNSYYLFLDRNTVYDVLLPAGESESEMVKKTGEVLYQEVVEQAGEISMAAGMRKQQAYQDVMQRLKEEYDRLKQEEGAHQKEQKAEPMYQNGEYSIQEVVYAVDTVSINKPTLLIRESEDEYTFRVPVWRHPEGEDGPRVKNSYGGYQFSVRKADCIARDEETVMCQIQKDSRFTLTGKNGDRIEITGKELMDCFDPVSEHRLNKKQSQSQIQFAAKKAPKVTL